MSNNVNRPRQQQQQQQVPQSNMDGWYLDNYGRRRRHHRRPRFWPFYAQNTPAPMYGNSFNAQQAPIQQQQQQFEEDYYGEDNFDEDYGSFDEEYDAQTQGQAPFQQQTLTSALSQQHEVFANMSDLELAQPAKVKYETVVFEAGRDIRPAQMFEKETMRLKNKGEITFSAENGHLVPIRASCADDVYNVAFSKTRNDLVKSCHISITSNYTKKLLVSLPTVGAIGKELFRNGADHVNFTIPAGVLSENKPYTVTFTRDISNGVIAFTNVFDSPSPDTMGDKIVNVTGRDYSLVPFTHSLIHYWNADPANIGCQITESSPLVNEDKDVRMKTVDVNKYLDIARKGVSQKLSLGNVTSGPKIVLSACEGTETRQMTLRSNKDGAAPVQPTFAGFADTNYHCGKNATENAKARYMETPIKFEITAEFEYAKIDGKAIELIK